MSGCPQVLKYLVDLAPTVKTFSERSSSLIFSQTSHELKETFSTVFSILNIA